MVPQWAWAWARLTAWIRAVWLSSGRIPWVQALVLTAIVIGFAMTALFLVVLLASRGLSDTDHVDGEEPDDGTGHVSIGSAAAAPPGESEEGRQA